MIGVNKKPVSPDPKNMSQNRRIILSFISAILFSLFLGFIDEGSYNFRWMLSPGNWIAFYFFTFLLFGIQLLVSEVILYKCGKTAKTLASLILSITLLFLVLLSLY